MSGCSSLSCPASLMGFSRSKQARPCYPPLLLCSSSSQSAALCYLFLPRTVDPALPDLSRPQTSPAARFDGDPTWIAEYLSKCQVHSDGSSTRQADGTFESSRARH